MKKYYKQLKENCKGDHTKKEMQEQEISLMEYDTNGDYIITLEEEAYINFKKEYENLDITECIDDIKADAKKYGFKEIDYLVFKNQAGDIIRLNTVYIEELNEIFCSEIDFIGGAENEK